MKRIECLKNYYENYDENFRLERKRGQVEFLTTIHYIEKYLKEGMKILEIGTGTGRYSHFFAQNGYKVDAVELVEHNIEIFKSNTKDGETVTIEGIEFKVIWTPGHTQGSCCYYFEKDNILISGDTLFEGSVGRSDLPTGDGKLLSRSLKERLMILPDETLVFPGHGNSTTIADEKKYNPFCR